VRRAWIGVAAFTSPLRVRIARHYELEQLSGVRVRSVETASPAAAAGLDPVT